MNQTLVQLVGTPLYVLGILLVVLNGSQHHVLFLVSGILEFSTLNRTTHPLFCIGIGGGSYLFATQLVFALFLRMLYPLVVLYAASHGNGCGAYAKILINQRILRGGQCRTTNQLALQRGIFLGGVRHLYIGTPCLFQHFFCLHGTPFVPPK